MKNRIRTMPRVANSFHPENQQFRVEKQVDNFLLPNFTHLFYISVNTFVFLN